MITRKQMIGIAAGGTLAAMLAFGAIAPQVSFAQETPASAPTGTPAQQPGMPGDWTARLAEQLGVTETQLQTAIDEVAAEIVAEAVAQGALTQEEGDAILTALSTTVTDGVAGSGAEMRDLLRAAQSIDFDVQTALADALGIDASEVVNGIPFGGSLFGGRGGDVPFGGGPGGVDRLARPELSAEEQATLTARREAVEALQPYLAGETFQNAIRDAWQAVIDEALADGALTSEQAATLSEQVSSENGLPLFGIGGHGGRGMAPGGFGPGGFGPGGERPAAPATDGTPESADEQG